MSTTSSELKERLQKARHLIDTRLREIEHPVEPSGLYDPVRYVLSSGGKRLRPLLVLVSGEIFGREWESTLPAALSVEVFHNFTLVHDDIMDNADERRGRPTVHVKWDASTALLCGDYLLALSYELLAGSPDADVSRLVKRFQRMVALLCEGQTLDKEFEMRPSVTVSEYLEMVDAKTGALLCTSLELGGMLGDADERHLNTLHAIGAATGRAFQIQDDLLDLTADDERWGKSIGGDLIEGKKTFLLLRAIELTEGGDREWFLNIVRENGLSPTRVEEARERMERSGVLVEARQEVFRYSEAALESTDGLPDVPAVASLRWLLSRMQDRLH